MNLYLYLLIENMPLNGGYALNTSQRNTLLARIVALGQGAMYPFPVRNDAQAGVFEGWFRGGDLGDYSVKTFLGSVFNVDPATIDIGYEATESYGDGSSKVRIFSRLGVDYLRVIVFGGLSATREESARECAAYLSANAAAWY